MIKFNEIKVGDFLIADNDGDKMQGEVTDLNGNEKQVCVNNGIQDFWYETDQLSAIPLDDEQLLKLKFHKQENEDGTVKYMKGAFRMMYCAVEPNSSFPTLDLRWMPMMISSAFFSCATTGSARNTAVRTANPPAMFERVLIAILLLIHQ